MANWASFETDEAEGVVRPAMLASRLLSGVESNLPSLRREGVRPSGGRRCVDLLGVASTLEAEPAGLAVASGSWGVGARRSNKPRTRPSRCGVGPIEVGAAGLKSLRAVEGVTASWV